MKKNLLTLLSLVALCAACSESFEESPPEKLDSDELRKILPTLDTRPSRDGVVYGVEIVDGVANPTEPRRIQDKDELAVDPISREELIENNKKEPIENRVQESLLGEFQDFSKGKIDDRPVVVIVQFVDDLDLPLLPEPNENESKDSEYNKKVSKNYEEVLRMLEEIRSQEIQKRLAEIPELAHADVLHIHTLINAVDLRINLSDIEHLTKLPDVQYISYQEEPAPLGTPPFSPAGNLRSSNNILDGKELINSTLYYPYTGGWIGIFDTGAARPGAHVLLNNRYFYTRDCVHGTSRHCTRGSSLNPWDNHGHGSASASILTGTNALGPRSVGVTNIILDSFKVYDETKSGTYLNNSAAVRAFEAAYPALDRTVLAEMQGSSNYRGSLAEAANKAFDLGVATAAAAGNYGPKAGTIAAPGNAHKVLAFGAYNVRSYDYELMDYSGRGPTEDLRIKPDLITPTNTMAADINRGPRALRSFGGTSGSSPYGAGAAALLRNFILSTGRPSEPGLVYAGLLSGGAKYNGARWGTSEGDNDMGAGRLRMQTNGYSYWGSVLVRSTPVLIPFNVKNRHFAALSFAIWWPEKTGQSHKEFRIGFRNFNCGSWSGYWPYNIESSVWQKYVTTRNCSGGKWYLQIIPENKKFRTQRVYYFIDASNDPF